MEALYHQVSFDTSKLVTQTYSTSFSKAVSVLAPEMQKAIYSIYGFVRFADEIVDTFLNSNQQQLLDNFERDLNDALENEISLNPILHAFSKTVKQYTIPRKYIDAFMHSMRMDLSKQNYVNYQETEEYIYGSAEVVGLMCLKVFVNGNEQLYTELEAPARSLGSAFQKVNFLRDLKADIEQLNRNYFADVSKDTFNEEVKQKLVSEIDLEFRQAKVGIEKLPGESKIAVFLAYTYYQRLLKKLRKTPAHKIISTRVRVSDAMKFLLYMESYFKYKVRLI